MLAVATWLYESIAVMVMLCVPTSPAVGVQAKLPEEFMSAFEILVPKNESLIVNVGAVNPYASVLNTTVVPGAMVELGAGAVSATETPEFT